MIKIVKEWQGAGGEQYMDGVLKKINSIPK
jgi:hypothetical protein